MDRNSLRGNAEGLKPDFQSLVDFNGNSFYVDTKKLYSILSGKNATDVRSALERYLVLSQYTPMDWNYPDVRVDFSDNVDGKFTMSIHYIYYYHDGLNVEKFTLDFEFIDGEEDLDGFYIFAVSL